MGHREVFFESQHVFTSDGPVAAPDEAYDDNPTAAELKAAEVAYPARVDKPRRCWVCGRDNELWCNHPQANWTGVAS